MKFSFPYEKILDHRKTVEEIARKEFMAARALVVAAEEKLRSLYDEIAASRARAGRLERAGGAQGPSLILIAEFIDGQKIRIERQRQKIRELQRDAEQKQEALIEAAKEYKTLEKLKEKRSKEFKRALKKKELKEIDEIVTTRFKRKGA